MSANSISLEHLFNLA